MSIELRREYLEILRSRYRGADKRTRSQIIDELVLNTGIHRKSAIRRLRKGMRPKRAGWGRKKSFSSECICLLRRIWRASDQQCSKKLKLMMAAWIGKLGETPEVLSKELQRMSPASIDRYLKPFRVIEKRKRNSGTRPGCRSLRQVIPMKNLGNIAPCAGHLEADTVAHCGGNMAGDFIWSLTITDTFSGWTENRAVWGKGAKNVHEAIEDIERNLPFDIQSLNVDNGSEFLNHRLVEYFSSGNRGPNGIRERFVMTRSRSYKKNDNAHVEQKNWTHVRQIFGYERFEFKDLLPLMNEIYKVQNIFSNFWIPQFKLKSKVRVGAKIKKTYHPPATPYHRLLADPSVSEESKSKLTAIYDATNPFELRERREALLASFFRMKRELQKEKELIESGSSESLLPGNTYS
jgi:hypothetical protein